MYFDRFDICEAYFLYFTEAHEGQTSDKYARLSHMLSYFNPSPVLKYETLTENGQAIYDNLTASESWHFH